MKIKKIDFHEARQMQGELHLQVYIDLDLETEREKFAHLSEEEQQIALCELLSQESFNKVFNQPFHPLTTLFRNKIRSLGFQEFKVRVASPPSFKDPALILGVNLEYAPPTFQLDQEFQAIIEHISEDAT